MRCGAEDSSVNVSVCGTVVSGLSDRGCYVAEATVCVRLDCEVYGSGSVL